jgi:threonine dehydrogenase-like Zn-dependent dehydrogenase
VLVKARFASICGSDLPMFRQSPMPQPSGDAQADAYWNTDGYCGHEVVGEVVASKSDRFAVGDTALALPASYFKGHAGYKTDWYQEEVHGVLLEPFPVQQTRGGFAEYYVSHELYCWPVSAPTRAMVAAQGLGCILRMVRKIGWDAAAADFGRRVAPSKAVGATCCVIGQGQNGLIAAAMLKIMGAAHVIGVDPVQARRAVSLKMGCAEAVVPADGAAAVAAPMGGRGADLVLEMVGHNTETIGLAIELARPGGTVLAFGVPDEPTYEFPYKAWFRKNLTMIASVIPDPQLDFPEAVRMVEEGVFDSAPLYTHTFGLAEIQRAFEMCSTYSDGVVKMVFDFEGARAAAAHTS